VRSVTKDPATPTGVLVRPDGVAAWASDTIDIAGLDPVLRRRTGAPSSSREHQPVG
jgi:hypothetical protein